MLHYSNSVLLLLLLHQSAAITASFSFIHNIIFSVYTKTKKPSLIRGPNPTWMLPTTPMTTTTRSSISRYNLRQRRTRGIANAQIKNQDADTKIPPNKKRRRLATTTRSTSRLALSRFDCIPQLITSSSTSYTTSSRNAVVVTPVKSESSVPFHSSNGNVVLSSSTSLQAASPNAIKVENGVSETQQQQVFTTEVANSKYVDLCVPANELRPSATLTNGQCFNWKAIQTKQDIATSEPDPTKTETTTVTTTVVPTSPEPTVNPSMVGSNSDVSSSMIVDKKNIEENNVGSNSTSTKSAWGSHNATDWIGTLRVSNGTNANTIVVAIRETVNSTLYRTLYKSNDSMDVDDILRSYFRVPPKQNTDANTKSNSNDVVELVPLYKEWSTQCDRLAQIAAAIPGVRIVDQDPFECVISFICSSNNNIPRITQMLTALRRQYGTKTSIRLRDYDCSSSDTTEMDTDDYLYSFPSLHDLRTKATEKDLRSQCGMGYRAKYIIQTLQILHDLGGESYLHQLRRTTDHEQVQTALMQFYGVGRKVADCIALFSLRQDTVVPVDVHVFHIAKRDYCNDADDDALQQTTKSITPTLYKQVGDIFRNRFPTMTGWATSLLFVAELPSFRPVLSDELRQEMDDFREYEKRQKKKAKK